jgi:hypothetical protein
MRSLGAMTVVEDPALVARETGWLTLRTDRPAQVRSLVPEVFEGYAGVLHPRADVDAGEEPGRLQDTLGQALTLVLSEILDAFTTTPDRCWCAVWEGYADMIGLRFDLTLPRLTFGDTSMIVARGPLSALPEQSLTDGGESDVDYRSPTLWWPADHAWCVTTDYEMETTLVGGSADCVAAMLADDQLEVVRVTAEQPLGDVG